MSEIISFSNPYHFAVYEHKIQCRKELSAARMIVMKNQDNRIVAFTGLEVFSFPYTGQKPKISVRQKAELIYICVALNHIFSRRKVQKLTDVTAEMIFDFFDDYCQLPKGRSEEIMRSQQSMDNCVRHVSSFFANLAKVFPLKYEPEDLMHYEETKASRHSQRIVRRYFPRYKPKRPHSYDDKLLRDMPLAAAARLVQLATIHDPMIAFGIVLQLSAGLRPSCVMNMRREDSPVSTAPGISMSYIGSAVSGIKLDLTHEYVLRSDGVSVGRIKREREVVVYKEFIEEVITAYKYHLQLLDKSPNLVKEWDWQKNIDATPQTVALHANHKYYWICQKCRHSWKASPNNRVSGKGCPKCAGHCVDPEINSFAAVNPLMIGQWDIEKNYPLTAWDIAAYDNRDCYWLCSNGHSFSASPANRTKGTKCPYCTGKLPVAGVNDFGTICSTVAAEWHPTKNGDCLPEHYLPNSHQKVWWLCEEGHEWQKMIHERANGSKCPYCQERAPIAGETDLASQYPELARHWCFARNKKGPDSYFPDGTTPIWWECEAGHSFRAPIREMVLRWRCPHCARKL